MPKLKDYLFGEDEDMSDSNDASNRLSQSSKKKKRRREGVGASEVADRSRNQDDMTQKVLQVGMRRRRDTDDDYDEEEFNEKPTTFGNEFADDDEEEDLGRTGIASNEGNTKKASSTDQVLLIDKGQHHDVGKKLGRKERKRLKKLEQEQSKDSLFSIEGDESDQGKQTKVEDGNSTAGKGGSCAPETMIIQNETNSNSKSGKRKRRKIRSRQKNIYKDNRPADKRPKHLVPGNRMYQGRPLTDETRSKLDLPPSKAFRSHNWEEYGHHTSTSTKGNDSHPNHVDSNSNNVGTPVVALGVDELLSEEKPNISNTSASKSNANKKKSNKKRKKYKNLSI